MKRTSYDHMNSYENFLKRNSYESYEKGGNKLSVNERNYMIDKAVEKLGISERFRPAVAKAANYIDGVRFWTIFECAAKAHSPAHYFIKAINKEMYR